MLLEEEKEAAGPSREAMEAARREQGESSISSQVAQTEPQTDSRTSPVHGFSQYVVHFMQ